MQMTRVRVEGLLAAFPKLVGNGKQHTYVETENVRYVYQPLECGTMYLLLVTTKGSNILEDLDVLRLLAKTLPEYTQGQVDEEGGACAAVDLIYERRRRGLDVCLRRVQGFIVVVDKVHGAGRRGVSWSFPPPGCACVMCTQSQRDHIRLGKSIPATVCDAQPSTTRWWNKQEQAP